MTLIEVIDETIFIWDALRHSPEASDSSWEVGVRTKTWVNFSAARAEVADLVVLSAELVDHVPAVLKVRAITRLGTRVGVLVNSEDTTIESRLRLEGASFVARRTTTTWEQFLGTLRAALASPPSSSNDFPRPGLTDRELQIAALFASRAAPTTQQIAELLALGPGTVRTHLKRARHRLGADGLVVSSREELRSGLLAAGYLVEEV
ncbi:MULTISPECIES: LuxR C-terminal-related transcriptional regulator [unclassified Pseudoclavibacter]|uniref:helix-turn-helix transcriptional regulator n=1 Tax=unclassified Pseudoclavibacter TaxID=2615177 RepID=UPI000CE79C74|nr:MULTISPECIES: LuxR C-terminal-related transcriptional regulator [unclassified Pseudoclavibacter]MBF4550082.1 response regulator transcription factor [Pseudoclavibacter sp. VKM Ac-2888]PPF38506.1 hypothetical protein C5E05_05735 [Pseudoclavibacter sp. AY1H1]